MKTVQLREAKATFSALVHAAERGEVTVVTKHGRPVAKLVPIEDDQNRTVAKKPSFVDWLMSIPAEIPFERDQTPVRAVDFE
jgi:antitoxin Phd